ncbi:MAG: DUF2817 domain-containing protein [Verrucomicrobia bacterium]|nr:DUF2817 domain-containing protein [Verrucomicrobiota bacterium]
MQRLGKNHGGYHGERIDVERVCHAAAHAARLHGWEVASIPFDGGGELLTFRRPHPGAQRNVYLSTGIHGDEPAGPLAVQRLLEENCWPANMNLFLCPCLNPTGFPDNRRENLHGKDLNRDYKHFETAEARAHVAWLAQQPAFDVAFCLHEDWESNGFYLYELNPDGLPSLGAPLYSCARAVRAMAGLTNSMNASAVCGWRRSRVVANTRMGILNGPGLALKKTSNPPSPVPPITVTGSARTPWT